MAHKQTKTNAMRMLEKEKVAYTFHEYDHEDGRHRRRFGGRQAGAGPARVFKTLVTQGASQKLLCVRDPGGGGAGSEKAQKQWGKRTWPCCMWRIF